MSTSIMPTPRQRYFNNDGTPAAGCLLYTYAATTSTPKATYTDFAGTIAHANPIVLDSKGEALIYFSGNYKIDLKTAGGLQITGYPVDNFQSFDAQISASDAALRAELAATNGGTLSGFIHSATGSVARTLYDKDLDVVNVLDFMTTAQRADIRTNTASLDVQAKLQLAATHGDMPLPNGTMLIKSGITFAEPVSMIGRGPKSIIKIASDFANATDALIVSPTAVEKRNWQFENFQVTNAGTAARNVFRLDLATAGKFLNKLRIKGVIADAVTGYFVELVNSIPNADGLFTGVFEDNWSTNGYYLENIGDSFILQRNTTTGAGYGYYVNQLNTASHIIIRDGNCTSASGIYVTRGYNVLFDNMQVEVPVTFTGVNGAVVSARNALSTLITNFRITNNNINTQANTTLNCIDLEWTDNAQIDGNTLYCNPTTGNHIIVNANARNTYIGLNKYYSSLDGTEITAKITDTGIGTMGIWKAPASSSWTTLIDAANGFPLGFFKTKDGVVMLRGNLTGAASTVGQTLFTLPVGFRPNTKVFVKYHGSSATANVGISILPTGEVQFINSGLTSIYLDGLTFSTR